MYLQQDEVPSMFRTGGFLGGREASGSFRRFGDSGETERYGSSGRFGGARRFGDCEEPEGYGAGGRSGGFRRNMPDDMFDGVDIPASGGVSGHEEGVADRSTYYSGGSGPRERTSGSFRPWTAPPARYGKKAPSDSLKNSYMGKQFSVTKAESLSYGVGDRVSHVKFGEGTVVDITEQKKDFEVTVDFDGPGRKRMYATFAKLKKI